MKTLLIIRHAKSSWTNDVLNDFDRPLNDRGHEEAIQMSKKILDQNIKIDLLVSSTANRAFTTCKYFASAFQINENDIIKVPELYHAVENIFYQTIEKLDDSKQSIALFSHNPGITDFVNHLTSNKIDDMPTCGIFGISININSWKDFKNAQKTFLFFDYPNSKQNTNFTN